MPELFFVFDCESIGIYGNTFAVGWVVIENQEGVTKEVEAERFVVDVDSPGLRGSVVAREWVAANCPAMKVTHESPTYMRYAFWKRMSEWIARGATVWTDCGLPVEAVHLLDCVVEADWKIKCPYPLHEIASVLYAAGKNPIGTFDRLPNELPKHEPIADARQSARILVECLTLIRKGLSNG